MRNVPLPSRLDQRGGVDAETVLALARAHLDLSDVQQAKLVLLRGAEHVTPRTQLMPGVALLRARGLTLEADTVESSLRKGD